MGEAHVFWRNGDDAPGISGFAAATGKVLSFHISGLVRRPDRVRYPFL